MLSLTNFKFKIHVLNILQDSRRSDQHLAGRCDKNIKVIFPKEPLARGDIIEQVKPGDYVAVKVGYILLRYYEEIDKCVYFCIRFMTQHPKFLKEMDCTKPLCLALRTTL